MVLDAERETDLDYKDEDNGEVANAEERPQDELFHSFIVKFITMIAVIVVLVISHAMHLRGSMLVFVPLGAGFILMMVFRYLGLWQWK